MIPDYVVNIFDGMLLASVALCACRMAIGPTAADRMVAIDLLGLLAAVVMLSHAIRVVDESVLDVVLVFSIVAFFGTVALARYLQRQTDEPLD